MDHALAPLRVGLQQRPVRVQAAHDVLGQLGTVHPDDGLPALAHLLPQRRHPLVHVRLLRAPPQEVRVRPEPVHPDPGAARPAEDLRTAADERVRPPPGQERGPVRAEDAAQQLLTDVVGEQPEVVHRRPRGVREVADPQVRAQLAEHPGDQGQVVVLDEDRRPGARLFGERPGEGPVVRLVGGPLAPELRVEDRLDGVWYSRWWTNHSTEFAMPLYASAWTSASMSSIRTPGSPTPRRTASRSPSPRAAQTHSLSSTALSPETRPPPPRLASSVPSSPSVYVIGPRLDATRTWAVEEGACSETM